MAGGVIGSENTQRISFLYMAHWDHLGMNLEIDGPDKIYNGAVDNATGTAAIIEIAEAFTGTGTQSRKICLIFSSYCRGIWTFRIGILRRETSCSAKKHNSRY